MSYAYWQVITPPVTPPSKKSRTEDTTDFPFLKMTGRTTPAKYRHNGQEVGRIYELIYQVAVSCDWVTLIMYKRVVQFIEPYTGKSGLRRFFQLMSETKAIVTGGIIQAMLLSFADPIYYTVKPFQLEMIVPENDGRIGLWKRFFHSAGFRKEREFKPQPPYVYLSRRSITLTRESNDDNLRICLLESISNDTIPTILASPHTSGMNILTPSRLYCFYPTLLQKGENILLSSNFASHGPETGFIPFNFGLRSYIHTESWHYQRRACGVQCPALWREVGKYRGILVMRWGGIEGYLDDGIDVSPSDGFEDSNLIWRMCDRCLNRSCPNLYRGYRAE